MATEKVTAGRDALGAFAPKFAELNDDVLFGQVWSREQLLSPRDRSLITVTALLSSGVLDSSLAFHMQKAKENGLTKTEIAEALTQLAFYSGWPKAWAAFRMALEVWKDGDGQAGAFEPLFPKGAPNDAYAAYFTGRSYLHPLAENPLVCNVTFEPGCPQLLAYTQGGRGRRPGPALHRRTGLVPGVGRTGASAAAGRYGRHPRGRETLARRGAGRLVFCICP